ncbi:MAG: hypothetical protein V3T84_06445 [Phycisphaerales bacterium]
MPVYGQFETVRVLSRGAVATIETARRVDRTGGDDYVVKVFRPFAFATDEDAERQLQLFLEQAEAQRAVASITGAHWAPVHELGKLADTAFYVTDRFDVHASQLIHGRAKLSESNLFDVLSGAAKGLLELQRAAGRPHGNLKLTNVLIRMGRRGGSARAVLSDPLPTSRIDHDRDAAFDRHALGELLYGLITHGRYPGPAAWPIEPDKTWLAIGLHAGQWCELCNALLAPPDAGEPLSLEELVDRLERLRPRAAAGAWRWAAALGGIALLAAVAILVYPLWLKPPPLPGLTLEEQLCQVCDALGTDKIGIGTDAEEKPGWLQQVKRIVVDESAFSSDSTALSEFAGLRETIDHLWPPIESLADAISGEPFNYNGDISLLCENVNTGAEGIANKFREIRTEGIVTDALTAVNEIKQTLIVWRPEALVQQTRRYRDIKWEQAAGILDGLVHNATFPEPLADTKWEEVKTAWDTAADFAESGLFEDIDDELTGLRDAFKAVSRELGEPQPNDGAIIALADDPDLENKVIENLQDLRSALAKLEGQPAALADRKRMIDDGDVDDENRKEAEQRTETMSEDLLGLLTSVEGPLDDYIDRLEKWVEKNMVLGLAFKGWVERVETLIVLLRPSIHSPGLGVDFLQEALRQRWKDKLEEFESRSQGLDPNSDKYGTLRSEIKSARDDVDLHRQALLAIENTLGTPVDLSGIPWQATFSPVVQRYRQEGLKQIADEISEPDRDGGDWRSIGETLDLWEEEDFNKWLAKRKDLLNDYVRIGDRLDDAFGVYEGFLGADDPDTIARLHANWTGEEYENMQPIVEEVRDRIDRIKRVENVTFDGLQAEIDIVLDRRVEDPAFTVAAWRKHCELVKPEPKMPEAEIELLGVVNEVIGGLQSAVRQGVLKGEVANRWLAREQELTERDDYPPLLAQRGTFHIDDERLDARLTFNIALEELKQWHETDAKAEDEQQQRKKIEEFIDGARDQPDLRANARGVLDDFIDLRDDEKTGPNPREIGPVFTYSSGGGGGVPGFKGTFVRWDYDEQQSDLENGILSYIWRGSAPRFDQRPRRPDHRLTFRQVRSGDEGPVTYLSIDEVSVGLFWDLVTHRTDNALMNGLPWGSLIWEGLAEAIPGGNPPGPVAWKWDGVSSPRGIIFTKKWMPDAEPDYYGVSVDVDTPADVHPIQQITPAAAIYVARLIDCRLPTVKEWEQAVGPVDVQKILTGPSPEEKWRRAVEFSALDEELPNLRDETWRRQRDYLAGLRGTIPPGPRRRSLSLPEWFGSPRNPEEGQGVEWDDETLWFRRTSQDATSQDGGRFRNIIGNVAEFVWRDHSSILKREFRSLDEIRISLRDQRENLPLQVIGGSALSDWVKVRVMEAQQIQRPDQEIGRSDVGFRLAFTAGPLKKSWERRLAELMDPTPPFVLAADTTDPPQGSSDGS